MSNPPHPGLVVKDVLIEGAELSVTDAADRLGVTRGALSNLINCHTGISPEMAVRLSILLVTSSEMWLNLR
jgi:addiction module HigA family antidote